MKFNTADVMGNMKFFDIVFPEYMRFDKESSSTKILFCLSAFFLSETRECDCI